MGLRQIQVTVPKDKGAEILELLSIPLARTMWLSIQRRGNERIVRQVLTRHPEPGEIRRLSVIAISGDRDLPWSCMLRNLHLQKFSGW